MNSQIGTSKIKTSISLCMIIKDEEANLHSCLKSVQTLVDESDALWAGVPVITLQGNHFPSRMSSSMLTALGLPELITSTLKEYESLAVDLARNPGKLQMIRQKLMKNHLVEPLFNTTRFTRNLEKAYKEMWTIFTAGEMPRQIEVVE